MNPYDLIEKLEALIDGRPANEVENMVVLIQDGAEDADDLMFRDIISVSVDKDDDVLIQI